VEPYLYFFKVTFAWWTGIGMDLALKFIELQVIDLTLWLIKDLFSG
jgi:hypothetical protein